MKLRIGVTNLSGKATAGAVVQIYDAENPENILDDGTTNSEGKFDGTIADDFARSEVRIVVSKSGFQVGEKNVRPNQSAETTIELRPASAPPYESEEPDDKEVLKPSESHGASKLRIHVTDLSGKAVVGAAIKVYDVESPETVLDNGASDGKGRYEGSVADDYARSKLRIVVSKARFEKWEKVVQPKQTRELTVELRPAVSRTNPWLAGTVTLVAVLAAGGMVYWAMKPALPKLPKLIFLSVEVTPPRVALGKRSELMVLAWAINGQPLSDATVSIIADEGELSASGSGTISPGSSEAKGSTDKEGQFLATWQCPKPVAEECALTIKVEKEGYVMAETNSSVFTALPSTDSRLPDLVITRVTPTLYRQVVPGSNCVFIVEVLNRGTADIPAGTMILVDVPNLARGMIRGGLKVNQPTPVSIRVMAPKARRTSITFQATVNASKAVKESNFNNNSSATMAISTTP